MKKIIGYILIVVLCMTVGACTSKENQKTVSEKEKVTQSQEVVKEDAKEGAKETKNSIEENDIQELEEQMYQNVDNKDAIRENMPKWAKAIKEVFIDRSKELSRGFDNRKNQILLVSSANDMALLINSQNKEVAPPEETVEYSARTLEATALKGLTSGFSTMDFNGHNTYVFNVDFWASMMNYEMMGLDIFDEIFKSIVHEGIHVLKQVDVRTMEQEMGTRSDQAEENIKARYYRNEVIAYMKEAVVETGEKRKELLQKAMYYHSLFKEEAKGEDSYYDLVEGEARFLERKALLMYKEKSIGEEELLAKVITSLRKLQYVSEDLQEELSKEVEATMKFEEPYVIGSLGIAILEQDGVRFEDAKETICDQILERYTPLEGKEHKGLKEKVEELYTLSGETNDNVVASFEEKTKDSEYVKVVIPLTDMNSSTTYENNFIAYTHEGKEGNLVTMTKEINHPNGNRIRIERALAFEVYNDDLGNSTLNSDDIEFMNVVLYIHKDEIEYKSGLLTIQTDKLLMFDIKAEEIEDGYKIITKE